MLLTNTWKIITHAFEHLYFTRHYFMCFTYSFSFHPHNNTIIFPILQIWHRDFKPLTYSYKASKQQNWDWNPGCLVLKPTLLTTVLDLVLEMSCFPFERYISFEGCWPQVTETLPNSVWNECFFHKTRNLEAGVYWHWCYSSAVSEPTSLLMVTS